MKVSPLLLIVLCLFMGFTFWVMAGAEQSLLAFGAQLMSSPDTAQAVFVSAGPLLYLVLRGGREPDPGKL
jgi:hypothetical protein